MKWIKTSIISGTFFVLLVINGCKLSKSSETTNSNKIPETYDGKKDSLNIANYSWKEFYKDPNLVELIDLALKNNIDVAIALQKIEMMRAHVGKAKGDLFPNLGFNLGSSMRRFGLYTMDGAGNISTDITPGQIVPVNLPDYYIGLQTTWEVDIWGKLRNKKKSAFLKYLSSVEGKNLVITNLIADLVSNYYELLALDNKLEIIKETIQIQESAFELVSVQKKAAEANELAVKQIKAQLLNTKAIEYDIVKQTIAVENQINFILNRFPQTIKRQKDIFNQTHNYSKEIGNPLDLLTNRPDIKQAELDMIASKADLKSAKAAFFPALTINGAYGYQAFQTGYLFNTPQSIAYSFLGNLLTPLLNRNNIKSEYKIASAAQKQAYLEYQKAILNGFNEVYFQLKNMENLNKMVELKTEEVSVLSEAIEVSFDLYKTGRADYIEVLTSQRSALSSKMELVDLKQQQFRSKIDLYKVLGGGWK